MRRRDMRKNKGTTNENVEFAVEFEKEYFKSLVHDYVTWKADDNDMECYFSDVEWMKFPVRFANDNSIVLDAGIKIYIEWGINECPVYVDIDGEYTRISRVRNSRFWALADRFKSKA